MTVATGDYTETTNDVPERHGDLRPGAQRPAALATGLEAAADGLDWLEALLGPFPFDSLGFLLVDSRSGMRRRP